MTNEPVVDISAEQMSKITKRALERALAGDIPKGDAISEQELQALPLPPFPGSAVKSFSWLKQAPGAYMIWVEGPANLDDVIAHFLSRFAAAGKRASVERPKPNRAVVSASAGAGIFLSRYDDGRVSAQFSYWP